MKIAPTFYLLLAMFSILLSSCSVANNSSEGTANIESLLKSRNYIFKAQTANPMRGSVIQLTSAYDLVVANDTVRTFLPYYGRAFTAPTNTGEGGIKITTTDFNYNLSDKRRKRWNITIIPNNDPNVREMLLSVSEGGYANLRVISNNRDPITFNGVVTAKN